jgi:hypothetical protein
MSISILHEPPSFQPVLTNGLFYTVSADTSNTFKFRYTYDLYVNGTNVFQGKATPNPSDLGVIDVSRILKTYVENNPIAVWNTTDIYTHQTFPFSRPYKNETTNYQVYFGYEYASSALASVTGFTGVSGLTGMTEGNPGVPTPVKKTFHSTMGVNGRATQQDFNMSPFVLSGSPTTSNPTTSGLYLTNSPRTRNIQDTEYYTLSFTNYYLDTTTISEPYYVEYKFFDDEGTLITGVTIDNITTNGGGPRPNCNQVYQELPIIIPSANTNYNTLYVGAGPVNLQDIIPPNTSQYTIQLFGKFTGTTSPIQPTPSPTPTPSSTPVVCACKEYNVFNASLEAQGILYYRDCNNVQRTLVVNPNEEFYICVCNLGDFTIEGGLIVTNTGDCEAPVPTPTATATPGLSPTPTPSVTRTSTPTPTLTPTPTQTLAGVPHSVNECFATCVTEECFCDSATPITLYMASGLSPGDIGENIYTDSGLTVLFFGDYQYGGIIYSASPISVVCTVGGGC